MRTFVLAVSMVCARSLLVTAGESPRRIDRPEAMIHCLEFSPDHRVVAIAEEGTGYQLRLVDFESGKTSSWLKGHTDKILALAFFPDGRRMATGGLDKTVRIWDIASRRQLAEVDTPRCVSLAFSPDGRTLISGHFDVQLRGHKVWDLAPEGRLEETKVIAIKSDSGEVGPSTLLRFAPDGRRVVSPGAPLPRSPRICPHDLEFPPRGG